MYANARASKHLPQRQQKPLWKVTCCCYYLLLSHIVYSSGKEIQPHRVPHFLQAGVQEDDEYLAELSRHLKAPVVLCVNKCENPKTAVAEAQVGLLQRASKRHGRLLLQ